MEISTKLLSVIVDEKVIKIGNQVGNNLWFGYTGNSMDFIDIETLEIKLIKLLDFPKINNLKELIELGEEKYG